MQSNVKRFGRKFLSLLLSASVISQLAVIPVSAAQTGATEIYFDDAVITERDAEQNLFLFGSKNMTVSEKSKDRYIMKIVRTGDASVPAEVDLKFTDVSADYGKNYEIYLAEDGTKPTEEPGRTSMVDFFLHNADSQEEIPAVSGEDILDLVTENGGFDTVDASGNTLSSVSFSAEETEDALDLGQLSERQMITDADSEAIGDAFPGTYFHLSFAAGETEKDIVVLPKYSRAADGDCLVSMTLKNPSEGFALPEDAFSAYLTIRDENDAAPAVLSFEKAEYSADGDSVSVTVTRSGRINEIVSANLCTVSDTAEIGTDFQGIDAALYFPMGIKSRTVDILVNHTSEDETLTFDAKLVNPVNCEIEDGVARVSIAPEETAVLAAETAQETAAAASAPTVDGTSAGSADEEKALLSAPEEEATLMADATNSAYDSYLSAALLPSEFTCFGNAWNSDSGNFHYSCKGVDYDTWNGGYYTFKNNYLYDGVRIQWSADHKGWGSTSYTYINIENGSTSRHVYGNEDGSWNTETRDVIFGAKTGTPRSEVLWIGSLTSYQNGISVDVKSVNLIYRTFDFTLAEADSIPFAGVDSATAKTYTAVTFANQTDATKTINAGFGSEFAVSAPSSQAEKARLVGLKFLDKDGKELYYQKNETNTRTVKVTLTGDLLSTLACDSLTYKKQSDGRYIGTVTVKPVFEYIDSKVTVKPSDFGSFTGDLAVTGAEKELSGYHLGDCLTISSAVDPAYNGRYIPSGVRYNKLDAEGKQIPGGSGTLDYGPDGTLAFTIDSPGLELTPVFSENSNAVRVQVLRSEVDGGVYDTNSGIFVDNTGRTTSGQYYVYTVSSSSVRPEQLVILRAIPSDAASVCTWTLNGQDKAFSGNTFFHSAQRDRNDNLVTLSSARAASYSFSGSLFHADKNLSTGNTSANPIIPADNALVSAGDIGVPTEADGAFALTAVTGAPETKVRLVIWSNGVYTLKDVGLNSSTSNYNLGVVTAAVSSADSACFTNVSCYQEGVIVSSTETLAMNGKKLDLYASVKDGTHYYIGDREYTEHVTGVTFYVLDGVTHEIKSAYPATKNSDGVYVASIARFTPDRPADYYSGDCFYVSMTTDRICAAGYDDAGKVPESLRTTTYAMMSTGYQILKDSSYSPGKVSIRVPISAAEILGNGSSGAKKNYASLPFLGALDFAVGVVGIGCLGETGNLYSKDDGSSGYTRKHALVRISISFETLPYGGTRMKIGVTATAGNNAWGVSPTQNPLATAKLFAPSSVDSSASKPKRGIEYLYNPTELSDKVNIFKSSFGTPRITFSVSFGVYIDFGIIETTNETTGSADFSDFVFLGVGGYVGGSLGVEYQWVTVIMGVPVYWGIAGSAGLDILLGATKDPNKVLMYSDLEDADGNFGTDDLHFNFDLVGYITVKGYGGVGIPDVIGVRAILGLNLSFVGSSNIDEFYPQLDDRWGLGLNLTLDGQIDYIISRIPISGMSVPLYSAGFNEYFLMLRRANKLVNFTQMAIVEDGANYDSDFVDTAQELADALSYSIMHNATLDQLKSRFNTLLDFVYNDKVHFISTYRRDSLYIDTAYDMWLNSEDGEAVADTMMHTDSTWVADCASLMGGYSEDTSSTLISDNYPQGTPKLMDLGGGNILMVVLQDTSKAGEAAKPTLIWSVYNEKTKTWTAPEPVQGDNTVDYSPSLCDAGDTVLITWSSAKDPYQAYSSDIEQMQDMDIYAATFDKKTLKLSGEIQQLTDDEYMDCKPSAIYDSESGDVAVYYLKNFNSSSDIKDYISTDSSVVCYRLREDGKWITRYYKEEYPNATEEERDAWSKEYGGQRFLSSAVKDDLPIRDITVAQGYNELGVYVYAVDMDGDLSTEADTELYLRVYDFKTHKTYKPIRLTDDDVAQARPQLVRDSETYTDYYTGKAGEMVDGTTYLFWLENNNRIRYLSVTDLVRNGINNDGTLKDDYLPVVADLNTTLGDGENQESSVSSYQAMTDKNGNLSIIWSQTCLDGSDPADISEAPALEIFAAAKIKDDLSGEAGYNKAKGTGGAEGSTWSAPCRLTESGECNDGLSGVLSESGRLLIAYNRYTMDYTRPSTENNVDENITINGSAYEVGSTDLMFTSYDPVGSVSVTDFELSEAYPCAGEEVTVTVTIENTGLTTAEGYTVTLYESHDGKVNYQKKLATFRSDDRLVARGTAVESFTWTVPADFVGTAIAAVSKEHGLNDETTTFSDPLEAKAVYDINVVEVRQEGDQFAAEYSVENIGNAVSAAGDAVDLSFAGLYGEYDRLYGLDSPNLASESLGTLEPGAEKAFTTSFKVAASAFEYCGYDQVCFTVNDADGNAVSNTEADYLVLEAPLNAAFENKEDLLLEVGAQAHLSVDLGSEFLASNASLVYSVDDSSVVTVDEKGQLTAAGPGTATVTVTVMPYGTELTKTVTVTDSGTPGTGFIDVPADSYYCDAVQWAVENGITNGTGGNMFSPDFPCTRAQIVTLLWRAAGQPETSSTDTAFTDIEPGTYYYEAVLWTTEKGITRGTSETTFSPDMSCSRAQIVTLLWRATGQPETSSTDTAFTDVDPGAYYYEAVLWATEKGITRGTSETTFSPDIPCTRAQIVTLLWRAADLPKAAPTDTDPAEAQ